MLENPCARVCVALTPPPSSQCGFGSPFNLQSMRQFVDVPHEKTDKAVPATHTPESDQPQGPGLPDSADAVVDKKNTKSAVGEAEQTIAVEAASDNEDNWYTIRKVSLRRGRNPPYNPAEETEAPEGPEGLEASSAPTTPQISRPSIALSSANHESPSLPIEPGRGREMSQEVEPYSTCASQDGDVAAAIDSPQGSTSHRVASSPHCQSSSSMRSRSDITDASPSPANRPPLDPSPPQRRGEKKIRRVQEPELSDNQAVECKAVSCETEPETLAKNVGQPEATRPLNAPEPASLVGAEKGRLWTIAEQRIIDLTKPNT